MRRRFDLILLGVLCCFINIYSQNYVNNPYSRYGVGDLINTGLAYNRSLGGNSIALRPTNQVNYLSPASYTSLDTLSFLFQGGLTGRMSKLSNTAEEDITGNFNIEYLLIGFPIAKWWKFSVGLVPYSRIQYHYRDYPYLETNEDISIDYIGSGGLNEFYFGTAYEIAGKISLGLNAAYLFGSLDKTRTVNSISSLIVEEKLIASDFYFRAGIQYYDTYWDRHKLIFGLTYDTKTEINISRDIYSRRNYPANSDPGIYVDTLNFVTDSSASLKLPQKIGIGVSYIYNEQLMISAQYTQQNFRKEFSHRGFNNITNYSSYRFGAEFLPVPVSDRQRSNYFERVHYRIGAHYTKTYVELNKTQINDFGFSVGLGLPWRNPSRLYTNSAFNITYEYGIRGTTDNQLIKENYHIITFGFTLHDFWFNKRKYD